MYLIEYLLRTFTSLMNIACRGESRNPLSHPV